MSQEPQLCENAPRRPSKRKPKPGSTRTGRRMLFLLLGLALCLLIFVIALYPMVMVGASQKASIKIPKNATSEMVRDSLTKYFGEGYSSTVMRISGLRGADFSKRYGRYTIQKGANALTAARKITSGAQSPVRLTINGFRNLPMLVERISHRLDFPADSLQKLLDNPEFMAKYGLTPANAMALFVDDTYEVYWTSTPAEVLEKIGENYNYLWSKGRKEKAAEMGLTPADMMIVASITDEETNIRDEKGTVGQLYINRLHNNMRLQADPTVRFAIGDYTIRRVTHNHLKYESPYNTYLHAGLPPGPIRTTSAKTVIAILDEKPNNYLYMCAKPDLSGSHNFASNYTDHLENAVKYQAELDRRGIN